MCYVINEWPLIGTSLSSSVQCRNMVYIKNGNDLISNWSLKLFTNGVMALREVLYDLAKYLNLRTENNDEKREGAKVVTSYKDNSLLCHK